MVEEFEKNCETLLRRKPLVEIAVGSLCFLEAAEFRKRLFHCYSGFSSDDGCAKLSFELPKPFDIRTNKVVASDSLLDSTIAETIATR